MALPLLASAELTCPFGVAPAVLQVPPLSRVTVGGLVPATLPDDLFGENILTFGMCNSLANPAVAAATAAALGVLTPMPCTPVVVTPWESPDPTVLVGGTPVVTAPAHCQCAFGGVIQALPAPSTVQYG